MYTIDYRFYFGDDSFEDYTFEAEWCDVEDALAYVMAEDAVYNDKDLDMKYATRCMKALIQGNVDYYAEAYEHELKEYFQDDAYNQYKEWKEWYE